jgi:hypothetical protein
MACYNIDIFKDPQFAGKLSCQSCNNVINNPYSDSMGHTFGKECLKKLLEAKAKCPIGKHELEAASITQNTMLANFVTILEVKCPNYMLCFWTGILSQIDQHVKEECNFQMMECPSEGCSFSDFRKSILEHQPTCPKQVLVCKLCEKNVLFKEAEQHQLDCMNEIVPCPFACFVPISKGTGTKNSQTNNKLSPSENLNSHLQIRNADMKEHCNSVESMSEHMLMIARKQEENFEHCLGRFDNTDDKLQKIEKLLIALSTKISSDNIEGKNALSNAILDLNKAIEVMPTISDLNDISVIKSANNAHNFNVSSKFDFKQPSPLVKPNQYQNSSNFEHNKTSSQVNRVPPFNLQNERLINQGFPEMKNQKFDYKDKSKEIIIKNQILNPKEAHNQKSIVSDLVFDRNSKGQFVDIDNQKRAKYNGTGGIVCLNKSVVDELIYRFRVINCYSDRFAIGLCSKSIVTSHNYFPIKNHSGNTGCFLFSANGYRKNNGTKDGFPKKEEKKFEMISGNIIEIQYNSKLKVLRILNKTHNKYDKMQLQTPPNINDLYPCILLSPDDEVEFCPPINMGNNKIVTFEVPSSRTNMRVLNNKVNASPAGNIVLLNSKLEPNKNYTFYINGKNSNTMSVGICFRSVIAGEKFSFTEVDTHGCYMFSSNGGQLHHGNQNWIFPPGPKALFKNEDMVTLVYDKLQKCLILINLTTGYDSKISIHLRKNQFEHLYPFVLLTSHGDEISVV